MIEVESLTQRYGTYTAVSDLSFQLSAGEVVGFLGPNGAGKTTTLKVLASYLAPSSGRVNVGGFDVLNESLAVRRVLGYPPERCPLYDEMLVSAFLRFVGQVRGLTPKDRTQAVGRVSELCGPREVLSRPCSDLSKGFRQRVGIAAALLHEPAILILDEPTSGLDPNQVLEVRQLVLELGRERTVLFSSHILSEVEATCRRVIVIHQGRLVADDGLDVLKQRITGGAMKVRFQEAPADLFERLGALDGVARVTPHGDALRVRPAAGVADLDARLFHFAAREDLTLVELSPVHITLEDVFGTLTGSAHA